MAHFRSPHCEPIKCKQEDSDRAQNWCKAEHVRKLCILKCSAPMGHLHHGCTCCPEPGNDQADCFNLLYVALPLPLYQPVHHALSQASHSHYGLRHMMRTATPFASGVTVRRPPQLTSGAPTSHHQVHGSGSISRHAWQLAAASMSLN